MLANTEDVLTRRGIDSMSDLEQRLYDEIGDANTAGMLNQLVGEVFTSATRSITMISSGTDIPVSAAEAEERRIIFNGNGQGKRPINNWEAVRKLSIQPAMLTVHRNGGPLMFSRTLLGEMIGDVFAVQGIYAGADNELGTPLAYVVRTERLHGLGSPLLSLLVLEWANLDMNNSSLSRLLKKGRLLDGGRLLNDYRHVITRLNDIAGNLAHAGFIIYDTQKPDEENLYTDSGRGPLRSKPPMEINAVNSVMALLAKREMSASGLAEELSYSLSHIQHILRWLTDRGYAEFYRGRPREKRSLIQSTKKSRRLCNYVDEPMSLIGFSPGRNGIDSIWDAPKLDVAGLVRYRESLIDPLVAYARKRAGFEEACRTAYQRQTAYRRRS
ncbi:MAG: winged helix-turn-helix transcriptional regulator [Candidatus Aenigmarchaeota archaeon]|nr:winged helix-turn-helix transcriptional regulator [Candidatus Aenigmarchaeota archaeon]